jgi:hypothetical protein
MTDAIEDTRSGLQMAEEAERAAYDAMTERQKVVHRLDAVIEALRHQVKHNAPVAPGHIAELEAIRAELG